MEYYLCWTDGRTTAEDKIAERWGRIEGGVHHVSSLSSTNLGSKATHGRDYLLSANYLLFQATAQPSVNPEDCISPVKEPAGLLMNGERWECKEACIHKWGAEKAVMSGTWKQMLTSTFSDNEVPFIRDTSSPAGQRTQWEATCWPTSSTPEWYLLLPKSLGAGNTPGILSAGSGRSSYLAHKVQHD